MKKDQKRIVDSKFIEDSYEAGSGALYIPILGDLFPKLWGQKMRGTKKFYVVADGIKYEVDKELYTKVEIGSTLIIHFSEHNSTDLTFSCGE